MTPQPIVAVVDSRIRIAKAQLSRSLFDALKRIATHDNPAYHKKRARRLSTFGVDTKIRTYRETDTHLELPRGTTNKVREVVDAAGGTIRFVDQRTVRAEVTWPERDGYEESRSYQVGAIDAALKKQQGIVRSPTGSGKTHAALEFARATRQPTIVVMRDRNLLKQWKRRIVKQLGIKASEIGELRGGVKPKIGPRITLALQQTLNSESFPLETVAGEFGCVIVDEVHGVAAKTFQETIDVFPAKYRIGFSADETRKDKCEFLVYDQFGEVVHETTLEELEDAGVIYRVTVRFVPTEFSADWYRDANSADRDFNRLLEEITTDSDRNELLLDLTADLVKRAERPVLMFSHRIEHAKWISNVGMFARGVTCGLMLGGPENEVRFNEDIARLDAGTLDVAAGTFGAIGQGIDVPRVEAGIMTTPFGNNRQFFNQVRGRVCRTAPGKTRAYLYVVWDRNVFPEMPKTYASWNRGLVEMWDADEEAWIPYSSRRR